MPPSLRRRAPMLGALVLLAACASLPIVGGRFRSHYWGFVVPWDARSAASAAEHGDRLDAVVTDWVGIDTLTGRPVAMSGAGATSGATGSTAAPANGARMMLVTSYAGDRFQTRVVRALAAAPARLGEAAGQIAAMARSRGDEGIVLDFEGHSSAEREALLGVVSAIADSAHRHDVSPVVVAVPATDTSGYPARAIIAAGADYVLVMLYDEHWAGSNPGPIASPDWARRHLATRIAEVGASRIVVGLPVYGYHWRPEAPTDVVGYADALRIATSAGLTLEREPASQTLRAVRPDSAQVWVADAFLLRALIDDAERAGVRRFSLWRLGLEDPAIWSQLP